MNKESMKKYITIFGFENLKGKGVLQNNYLKKSHKRFILESFSNYAK